MVCLAQTQLSRNNGGGGGGRGGSDGTNEVHVASRDGVHPPYLPFLLTSIQPLSSLSMFILSYSFLLLFACAFAAAASSYFLFA